MPLPHLFPRLLTRRHNQQVELCQEAAAAPKTNSTTPPKFNITPEKCLLEDDPFLFGWYIFRGYVKLPGGIGLGPGGLDSWIPLFSKGLESLYRVPRPLNPKPPRPQTNNEHHSLTNPQIEKKGGKKQSRVKTNKSNHWSMRSMILNSNICRIL